MTKRVKLLKLPVVEVVAARAFKNAVQTWNLSDSEIADTGPGYSPMCDHWDACLYIAKEVHSNGEVLFEAEVWTDEDVRITYLNLSRLTLRGPVEQFVRGPNVRKP
jgi:hypothetical protein